MPNPQKTLDETASQIATDLADHAFRGMVDAMIRIVDTAPPRLRPIVLGSCLAMIVHKAEGWRNDDGVFERHPEVQGLYNAAYDASLAALREGKGNIDVDCN